MPKWRSPSSQKQFLNCERDWYYDRVLKMPRGKSHFLSIGGLYHNVFEHCVRSKKQEWRDKEWLERLIDDLYVEAASSPEWTCPTSELNLKKEIAANTDRLGEELWAPLLNAGAELTAEIEHKYLARVDLRTSRRPDIHMGEVVGVIDEPGVLDYKIKFSTWSRREDDAADNDEQLAMYAVLEDVRWCGFVEIPRSLKAPINIIYKHYTDAEIEWWRSYFDQFSQTVESRCDRSHGEAAEEIEHRFRLAHPSSRLCDSRWCNHWGHCPGGGK